MSLSGAQVTSLSVLGTPFTGFFDLIEPTPPTELIDTTMVYGTLLDPSGDPRVGVVLVYTLLEKIEPDIYVIEKGLTEEVLTDADGYFEIELAAGKYGLTIDCYAYADVCVPVVESINLQDLI